MVAHMAYAPLGQGTANEMFAEPAVVELAAKYGKTPAQVLLRRTVQDGVAVGASVDMGAPILDPAAIPVVTDCKPPVDVPITVHDKVYKMTCVSMGNPHAVVFIDHSPREFPLEQVGPLFEHHPCFSGLRLRRLCHGGSGDSGRLCRPPGDGSSAGRRLADQLER